MKIKKFNEIASDMSEEQLNGFRKRRFPNETIIEYELWGEDLKYSIPDYIKLFTGYSVEECVNYYNNEILNSFSRVNKYENFLLLEKTKTNKQIDFSIFIKSNKYNI
jgi:hypothetical protein